MRDWVRRHFRQDDEDPEREGAVDEQESVERLTASDTTLHTAEALPQDGQHEQGATLSTIASVEDAAHATAGGTMADEISQPAQSISPDMPPPASKDDAISVVPDAETAPDTQASEMAQRIVSPEAGLLAAADGEQDSVAESADTERKAFSSGDEKPTESSIAAVESATAGSLEDIGDAAQSTPDATAVELPGDDTAAQVITAELTIPEAPPVDSSTAHPALPRGTIVGGRYTILGSADERKGDGGETRYLAIDELAYQRCWSCGSTENSTGMRFCQSCGAGLQDHPILLVWTATPTGHSDEFPAPGGFVHVALQRRYFGADGIDIQLGAYSAEGPHHPNEDTYWYTSSTICANSRRESHGVIIFADGMGGYRPGSGLISRRAAEVTGETLWSGLAPYRIQNADLPDEQHIEVLVRQAIAAGNNAVIDEIRRVGYDMGCTLIVAVVLGDTAYLANIGDSRAYYLSPAGAAEQITDDQSQVGALVRLGQLAPEAVYTAVGNNMILHAIGEEGVEQAADWSKQALEPGSFLILCSDGYWKTERGIGPARDIIAQSPSLGEAARVLVNDALDRGSDDNISVVLVRVS